MLRFCLATLATLILTLPIATHAKETKSFNDTIEIQRDDQGKIGKVVLKEKSGFLPGEMQAEKFISEISKAQEELNANSHFAEDFLNSEEWPEKHREKAKEALANLKAGDIKSVLENPEIKKALSIIFEAANSETHNFRILAVPENRNYYDSNETGLKMIRQVSGLIKLAVGNSYGVAIALFVAQTAFDMALERRAYFQNYILYHFERYGPEKFGVTHEEARKIKSSIFESRIQWWKFWEKNKARDTWERYGHGKHIDNLIAADRRRKAETLELNHWGERFGYAFQDGHVGSVRKVVNLVTPRNITSKKLSHAFDFSSPTKIRALRLFYFLLQLGVRLAPVPAVSTIFDFFVDSLYVPQRQMEGALYGYFADIGQGSEARSIAAQSINPFIISEVMNW